MTVRLAHGLGYRYPDLAWLKLRDLELLLPERSADELGPVDSDAAFTL
ncbi:MAG: hypothetical protein JW990_20915 [Thermoleophilia bacterium]|nr:hypothetical protein [Thermoleophilia bacterium]